MITNSTRRYVAPSITPDVEGVSLRDFDIDDVREYLRRYDSNDWKSPDVDPRESALSGSPNMTALVISPDDLNRINTLALCGQREVARAELLSIVSNHIGRQL